MIKINGNDSFEYVMAGVLKSDENWCHPRRIKDSYEIIFMYDGVAYIGEEGIDYTLHKDDVLFLEPGREHYGIRPSGEDVSFAWIHYYTDHEPYKNLPKCFHADDPYTLKTLFSQCLHAANTPSYPPVCSDYYTALIAEEVLRLAKTSTPAQNYLASRIKDFVDLNTDSNLSVGDISEHFGYHENHVSRIFKAAYSMPLKAYITRRQVEYAHNLLNTTLYTVGQIAAMLSFRSENHFIKFFKYHTKMTPSEYRNSYTGTHSNKR